MRIARKLNSEKYFDLEPFEKQFDKDKPFQCWNDSINFLFRLLFLFKELETRLFAIKLELSGEF